MVNCIIRIQKSISYIVYNELLKKYNKYIYLLSKYNDDKLVTSMNSHSGTIGGFVIGQDIERNAKFEGAKRII